MSSCSEFQALSSNQLIQVNGGDFIPEWLKTAGRIVGKKFLGPVSALWTGYAAVDSFLTAREQGKDVGESLVEGVKGGLF